MGSLRTVHDQCTEMRMWIVGKGCYGYKPPKHSDGFLELLKKYVQPSSDVEPAQASPPN